MFSTTLAAASVAARVVLAQPTETGSISSGHRIAITICGNCHEVPGSSRKTAIGPKLEDIANRPSTTALSLKEFLGSRHKKRMPNFLISRADTEDVIAIFSASNRPRMPDYLGKRLSEQRLSVFPQSMDDFTCGNCFRQTGRLTGPGLNSLYVILLNRGIAHGLG